MERMAPKNKLFILPQPNKWPMPDPKLIIQNRMRHAATIGPPPILTIFLKLNSSPNVNIRNITPISAHTLSVAVLATDGV